MVTLKSIIPKLPSRNIEETRDFYVNKLNFKQQGETYPDYLMVTRDGFEIHFFLFRELVISENYGQCYIRVTDADGLYEELKQSIPDLKKPEVKPWGQKELHLNDNNYNNLTFGEGR